MIRFLSILFICSFFTAASAEEWKETLKLPFGSNPRDRASLEIPKNFDLSTTDEVHITLSIDKPEVVGRVTLHFRSGGGWYRLTSAVEKSGKQTLVFLPSRRATEGTPEGLNKIDLLRLTFWRREREDAKVELHGWELVTYPIVLLNPDDSKGTDARRIARNFQLRLTSHGISVSVLEQADLTTAALENRRVIILPLNSDLTAEQVAVLQRHVESDGKLIAFFRLPDPLMESLGFASGTPVRSPQGAEAFAKVLFDPWFSQEFGEGTPSAFEQQSEYIFSAKLLNSTDNFNARVAAVWCDASDKITHHPALLVSDRGALFSHILLAGDTDRKWATVLALLAHWSPNLWADIMKKRMAMLYTIGETSFETEPEKTVRMDNITRKIKPYADSWDTRRFCVVFPALRKELADEYIRSLPSKPGEQRLWWEHTGTGVYPGDWDRTMKELKENGFNAVISNMLMGGLAHYDSKLLPRSQTFDGYGDQIEQAVRAGKKYGVEVHVWKVTFNCTKAPREFIDSMRQAERMQVRFDGNEDSNSQYRHWLCPSHPENRKLECEAMIEVVKNYDVDGIHFDYIRYPNSQHCYCKGCKERFEKHVGETIVDWPQATRTDRWKSKFDDWRCDQITALVADVNRETKKVKPSIKISAAVFPKYPECRSSVLQDWPIWIEKGYLDFLCPMSYTASVTEFDAYVEDYVKLIAGKIPVYPGIGATATNLSLTPDQVAAQIMIARKRGTAGFAIFHLDRYTMEKISSVLSLGPTKP